VLGALAQSAQATRDSAPAKLIATDHWARRWRQRVARGKVMIIRYGDDILVRLQHPDDTKCFRSDMQDRLARRG
jgi:hypothetical protein